MRRGAGGWKLIKIFTVYYSQLNRTTSTVSTLKKWTLKLEKKIHLASAEILLLLYATVFLSRFKTFQFTSKRNDSKINSVLQHSKVYDTFHFEHGIWLLDEGINCVEFKFISAQLHMALLIFFPLQKCIKKV